VSGLHTIGRWIGDRARATPARVAIEYGGRELTYAELDELANRFAAGFVDRGLSRGDRVATLTGNSPEHVAVCFACAKLGLILVPISWRLAAPEIAFQLADSEPSLFLVEEEHRALAEGAGHASEPLTPPNRLVAQSHKAWTTCASALRCPEGGGGSPRRGRLEPSERGRRAR
jgi:acyl-CoA synthetase (AMP-forming)/AMP-acid ligase II